MCPLNNTIHFTTDEGYELTHEVLERFLEFLADVSSEI